MLASTVGLPTSDHQVKEILCNYSEQLSSQLLRGPVRLTTKVNYLTIMRGKCPLKASHLLLFFIRDKVGHSSLNQAFSQEFVSRHRWHSLQHPNQQPRHSVVKKKKHGTGG